MMVRQTFLSPMGAPCVTSARCDRCWTSFTCRQTHRRGGFFPSAESPNSKITGRAAPLPSGSRWQLGQKSDIPPPANSSMPRNLDELHRHCRPHRLRISGRNPAPPPTRPPDVSVPELANFLAACGCTGDAFAGYRASFTSYLLATSRSRKRGSSPTAGLTSANNCKRSPIIPWAAVFTVPRPSAISPSESALRPCFAGGEIDGNKKSKNPDPPGAHYSPNRCPRQRSSAGLRGWYP